MTLTLLAVLLAAAGAAAGPATARLSSRLSAAQPVAQDPDAELTLLRAAVASPADALEVADGCSLTADDFASLTHAEAWSALTGTAHHQDGGHRVWRAAGAALAEQLASQARDGSGLEVPTVDQARAAAAAVASSADSRSIIGRLAPERAEQAGQVPEGPALRHPYRPPGRARTLIHAGGLALVGAAGPALAAASGLDGAWAGAAAAVLLAAAVVGAVIASVDADTCYVDLRVLVPATCVLLPAVVVVSAGGRGAWLPAALTVGTTLVLAAGLEALNLAYRAVRGHDGLGGGDPLLLPLAFGVPATLSGTPITATTALLLAPACLLAWLGAARARRALVAGSRRSLPAPAEYPFGPALVAGGLAAWPVLALIGVA